jgi:hypothetical protein
LHLVFNKPTTKKGEKHSYHSPKAYPVTAITLNVPIAEASKNEQSDAISTHYDTHLVLRKAGYTEHPYRQNRDEHINRHGYKQVGNGQNPKVGMPKTDVYWGVLGIHSFVVK